AITVGTNIAGYVPVMGAGVRNMLLGGADVGSATLLRFYVLHVYFVPALLVIGLCIHIWRVRKDGFAIAVREDAAAPVAEIAVVVEEVSADA
ncbi:MAG: cytochrome b N-terminal domain-containing protein, partial [Actinomycetota bacterium]